MPVFIGDVFAGGGGRGGIALQRQVAVIGV